MLAIDTQTMHKSKPSLRSCSVLHWVCKELQQCQLVHQCILRHVRQTLGMLVRAASS